MSEKTAKQVQLDKNRLEAAAVLKEAFGDKPIRQANIMRFITHRRAGKNNKAFIENLMTRTPAPKVEKAIKKVVAANVNVAAAAGAAAGAAAAAKNIAAATATKNEYFLQAQRNLTAKFAPYGKKPHVAYAQALAATRRKGKSNANIMAKINAVLGKLGTAAAVEGAAAGAAAVEAAAVEGAVNAAKKISGHVAAGKKAATSEKGSAWLANVKKGRNNLTRALNSAGRNTKLSGKNAIKYASLMRKNAAAAEAFKEMLVEAAKTKKNNKKA